MEVSESHSPEETISQGEAFAKKYLNAGVVVALRGELGAGKTHFVKGIARALAIDDHELTSPTFALANEYDAVLNGDQFALFHLDCYRFEKPEELLQLGVEDYLYPTLGATVIEWPERIEKLLPPNHIEVTIHVLSEFDRKIEVLE